jgi:hypothetical protein
MTRKRARQALTMMWFSSFLLAGACSGETDDNAANGGTPGSAGGNVGYGGRVSAGNAGSAEAGAPSATGGADSAGGGSDAVAGGGAQSGDAGSPGSAGHGPAINLCDGKTRFAGENYCSEIDACAALDCGKPWSLYDANGCRRLDCTGGETCPQGQRCVLAALTGNFARSCFADVDGCEYQGSENSCSCVDYECVPTRICLPESDFPESHDCPIEGLDCAELAAAKAGLSAYRANLLMVIEDPNAEVPGDDEYRACHAKLDARLAECP